MFYEGWPLVPLLLVSPRAHYLISFVETVARRVCDLTSLHVHAKCALEYFCNECNALVSFCFGLWFYSFSPMSENISWIYFSYFCYPTPLSVCFLFLRGKKQLCVPSFYALGQFCCVVLWSWIQSCFSTQHQPLVCETNEKCKMTSSKRKWFVLWGKTWKDTSPRTLGALFSLLSTAGFTHFKITSDFS